MSRGFLLRVIGTDCQNGWSASQTSLSRRNSSVGSWLEIGLSYPQSSKRGNECFLSNGVGVGQREVAAADESSDFFAVDGLGFGLSSVDGFHVQGVTEDEGDVLAVH